jgi:biotin operon repressor
MRQSWGWQKESVELRLKDIVKATGLSRQNANKAIKSLKRQKLIIVVNIDYKPTKRYRINYKNRLLKYQDKIDVVNIDYKPDIKSGNETKNGILSDPEACSPNRLQNVVQTDYTCSPNRLQNVVQIDYNARYGSATGAALQEPKERKKYIKKKKERKKPGKESKNNSFPAFSDNRVRKAKKLTEKECEDRIAKLRKQAEQIENDEKFKN